MSSLQVQADLVAAVLDLELVRLLRQAIRVADLSGHKACDILGPGDCHDECDRYEPCHHVCPEPKYEPRRHIHPTPVIEPRKVLHPAPRVVESEQELSCPAECDAECPRPGSESPIQPPWKVLPWQEPAKPAVKIKVVRYRPDIIHKGSLIDFFI